jgi:hypothetical protein
MSAEVIQFIPKANPKSLEDQAIEIMKHINRGWFTEKQIAEPKAPKD